MVERWIPVSDRLPESGQRVIVCRKQCNLSSRFREYTDWDAAAYLAEVLKLLSPKRKVNIPDFKYIIQSLIRHDGVDICDNCHDFYKCSDCIIKDWKEEME